MVFEEELNINRLSIGYVSKSSNKKLESVSKLFWRFVFEQLVDLGNNIFCYLCLKGPASACEEDRLLSRCPLIFKLTLFIGCIVLELLNSLLFSELFLFIGLAQILESSSVLSNT